MSLKGIPAEKRALKKKLLEASQCGNNISLICSAPGPFHRVVLHMFNESELGLTLRVWKLSQA